MMKTEMLQGELAQRMINVMAGPLASGFVAGVKASAAKIAPATASAQFVAVSVSNGACFIIPMINLPRIQVRVSDHSDETAGITPAEIGILASLAGLQKCSETLTYRGETQAAKTAAGFHSRLLEYIHNKGGYLDGCNEENRAQFEAILGEYGGHLN